MAISLAWVLLISALIYVAALFHVVALLKKNHPDYWQRIGSPNLFNANNITTVFPKIILGLDIPRDIASEYQGILLALRISLVISLIVFLAMLAIMALGMAPT